MTRTSENDDHKPSALSRRDFLKYGAATGAVVGALHLGVQPRGVEAAPPDGDAPRRAVGGPGGPGVDSFEVDIPGLPETSANVESVDVEDLTIDVREMTTGADWDYRVYEPGEAHYGSITIRARVGKDSKELYQWWLDNSTGKNIRKDISIVLKSRDGGEARRFNMFECFPTRWDAGDYSPSSKVAIETIVCKMQRVELA